MKAGWGIHWLEAWQYRRKVIIRISVGQQGQRRHCWPCTSICDGECWYSRGVLRRLWQRQTTGLHWWAVSIFPPCLVFLVCFFFFNRALSLFLLLFCGFAFLFFLILYPSDIWFASSQWKFHHGLLTKRFIFFFYSGRKFCLFSSHKIDLLLHHDLKSVASSWL